MSLEAMSMNMIGLLLLRTELTALSSPWAERKRSDSLAKVVFIPFAFRDLACRSVANSAVITGVVFLALMFRSQKMT